MTTPSTELLRGRPVVERIIQIAAVGGHSTLVLGCPSSGRHEIARLAAELLPDPTGKTRRELECTYETGGLEAPEHRPIREPKTVTRAAAALAHGGALIADVDSLSDPEVEVIREAACFGSVSDRYHRPARVAFEAIGQYSPCGGDVGDCQCSPEEYERYSARLLSLSSPRFLLALVFPPAVPSLASGSFEKLRAAVAAGRKRSMKRQGCPNAWLEGAQCQLDDLCEGSRRILDGILGVAPLDDEHVQQLLRIARSAADLDSKAGIEPWHIGEAAYLMPVYTLRYWGKS